MRHAIWRHYRRLRLFAGIVWRHDGTGRGRVSVRTAWAVSGILWSE